MSLLRHPRYWALFLGLGVLRVLALLPNRLRVFVGQGFGRLAYWIGPVRRRKIAWINLGYCFPAMLPADRLALLKSHYASLGIGLLESALAWWGSDRAVAQCYTVEGIKHFEQAKAARRGVLLLVPHSTSLELLGRITGLVVGPYATMAGHQRDAVIDQLIFTSRTRYIAQVISAHRPLGVFRQLKAGNVVTMMPDHDHGLRHSLFAPFFGVQAATLLATRLYAKNQAAVLMLSIRRTRGGRYICQFSPILEGFPSRSALNDVTRVNRLVEQAVLAAPEQYWWAYRRFKTRPEGERGIY